MPSWMRFVTFSAGLALFAAAGVLSGCEQSLFSERLPRTQYERFDRMHGRYAPKEQVGPGGFEQPALRERLRAYE